MQCPVQQSLLLRSILACQHSALITANHWADLIFNGRMRQMLCFGRTLPSFLSDAERRRRRQRRRRRRQRRRRRRYAPGCASSLALLRARKSGSELVACRW